MIFEGSSLWLLIKQSDAATWVILLVLLSISIICWAVAAHKIFLLRRLLAEARAVAAGVTRCDTMEALKNFQHQMAHVAGISLLRATHYFSLHHMKWTRAAPYNLRDDLLLLRDELDVHIAEAVSEAECYSVILKTAAEAAPLLGLLGTIWGLIHSFMRISSERNADIITVAPGIAEALVTTLMGLIVAIPALIFFHIVYRAVQVYEQELIIIADHCERLVRDLALQDTRS